MEVSEHTNKGKDIAVIAALQIGRCLKPLWLVRGGVKIHTYVYKRERTMQSMDRRHDVSVGVDGKRLRQMGAQYTLAETKSSP